MLLFDDHRSVVYTVAFSPDGATLATGSKDGSLCLRGPDGAFYLMEGGRGPLTPPVQAVEFLPTQPTLVVGGVFGWVGQKRVEDSWQQFGPSIFPPVTSLAVIDDRTIAIGTGDRVKGTPGALEIWDIAADRKLSPYFYQPNGVRAMAAAPKKKLIAWATGHRVVSVWDITRPKPVAFPQSSNCPAVALTPDGTRLAVALDWTARVIDLEKRSERFVLKGHKGQVSAVAFSPDGQTLATGSWDMTIRLWDVATGRERANYKWDIGRVYCLTYAPDGLRLAAGGDLGRVIVWDAE